MLDLKLHIKSLSNASFVEKKQRKYSYARKHLYKHLKSIDKKDLEDYVVNKFGFNDIESRSLINEVNSLHEKIQTNKEQTSLRIVEIEELLKELKVKAKKSKKDKRDEFKLENKLVRLNKSLSKDITFGGKELLKEISYLNNKFYKNLEENEDDFDFELYRRLNKAKEEYKLKRINSIYLLGEANQKGNRFFEFDLKNQTIYYKPKSGIKIEIKITDKRKKELKKLQELIENRDLAISVRLSTDSISLLYDEKVVSGFLIDIKERTKEIQKIKKEHINKDTITTLIKETYIKYYNELDQKMLKGKKSNRYFSNDTNPNYIGCSILDKINNEFKIVYVFYYDISDLNNIKRIDINNKRTHGIKHIWKDIFNIINYYKCAYFVKEKLTFTKKEIKENKEFNRQTKNVWYRTLSNNLITKYCNKYGIKIIEINAVYSSTIGNLIHNYVDCINAAIEIGRRGIFKFIKDTFYPEITKTDFHAMSRLNSVQSRDVETLKECSSWNEIHQSIFKSGLRYRKSLLDLSLIGCTKIYTKSSKLKHSYIQKVTFN